MTTMLWAAALSMIESIHSQYRSDAGEAPAVEKSPGVAKGGSPSGSFGASALTS